MTRLSPAREAEIRAMDVNAQGWAVTREVLVELDAVRADRGEIVERWRGTCDELDAVRRERDEAIESALYLEGRWRATLAERDEAVKVAATMRDALDTILCRIEDANHPFLPFDLAHVARAALAAVPSSTVWPDNPGVVAAAAVFRSRESTDGPEAA